VGARSGKSRKKSGAKSHAKVVNSPKAGDETEGNGGSPTAKEIGTQGKCKMGYVRMKEIALSFPTEVNDFYTTTACRQAFRTNSRVGIGGETDTAWRFKNSRNLRASRGPRMRNVSNRVHLNTRTLHVAMRGGTYRKIVEDRQQGGEPIGLRKKAEVKKVDRFLAGTRKENCNRRPQIRRLSPETGT